MSAATVRQEAALRAWLDELPALAASLDVEPTARAVLLDDAAADAEVVTRCGADVHPVLRARGHLALGTIDLVRASASGDETMVDAALDSLEAAAGVARRLDASGPRLRLLGQIGSLLALGGPFARHARRRAVGRRVLDLADDIAEAFAEQAELTRRGTATLVAAQALAEGASAVTARAAPAVRRRARELAEDARRDLVRAGELALARAAAATAASLRAG